MTKPKTIEVVYEDGVFKPLEPVELEEGGNCKSKDRREKRDFGEICRYYKA